MAKGSLNTEKKFSKGAIVFALLLLCNPNIAFFDILPDFIGYFVLMRAVSFSAKRVPFFEEARQGFFKLALLSLARFPAVLLSTFIRGANTSDGDIIALLSFVFSVLEAIFAFGCIANLFAGISHLGTRTGMKSVIGENPSAETLRSLTVLFMAVKCAASALPEFARLTSADSIGTVTTAFESMRYYPISFVIGQSLGYVFGFVWLAYFTRYLSAISASGEFYPAVMMLSSETREREIARKTKLDKVRYGLKLMIPAAFLSFDFTLTQAKNVNILPHFILGILLLFAILKFAVVKKRIHIITFLFGGLYIAAALVSWILTIRFHTRFSFTDLKLHSEAMELYRILEAASFSELLLFVPFAVFFTLSLIAFIKTHTGQAPSGVFDPLSEEREVAPYTSYDARCHRALTVRAWVFAAIGILGALARFLSVLIKADREFAHGALIPSVAPWFSVVVLILSAIWGFYTYMLVGTLDEDFSMKYAASKHASDNLDENRE